MESSNSSTQYLTKVVTPQPGVTNLKVPIGLEGVDYKTQRRYIKYLDCKAQTVEGVFKNVRNRTYSASHRQYYRRVIKELLNHGWARPCAQGEHADIALLSYQSVWRSMGIMRFKRRRPRKHFKDSSRQGSGTYFPYHKILVEKLSLSRKHYYKEIQDTIRDHIAERKRAQIRYRQRLNYGKSRQATFGAKRAALLFGYRSASTGSKLRKKHFSIVSGETKPYFNRQNGRWEEPCKQIEL